MIKVLILGISLLAGTGCTPSLSPNPGDGTAPETDSTTSHPKSSVPRDGEGSSALTQLAGHWRSAERDEETKRRLRAIEQATDGLGFLQRNPARSRLSERTAPSPRLTIEISGSRVTLETESRRLALELGGKPVEVAEGQETSRVFAKTDGEQLIIVAESERGNRTTAYRLSGSLLSVAASLTSDRLARPLKYETTYTRIE